MKSEKSIEKSPTRARWAVVVLAVICLLWAGMVMGITFLETPVKFSAPSLNRAEALDVGRVVFNAFGKVQLVLCAITNALLFVARPFRPLPRAIMVLFALVWLITIFQIAYLIPALAVRAQMVMMNQTPPPAPYHALISGTELVKFFSLVALGVLLMGRVGRSDV